MLERKKLKRINVNGQLFWTPKYSISFHSSLRNDKIMDCPLLQPNLSSSCEKQETTSDFMTFTFKNKSCKTFKELVWKIPF